MSDAGLRTTELPAASAGATFQQAMRNEKFHGVIAATTPTGSFEVKRLRPWLKVFDGLLKGVKPGQVFIYRSEETKELWEEFADLIESFRIMVARPELWAQDFTVSLVGLLAPEERLSMRSEAARLVWAGGDATLEVFAFIDWTFKKYFMLVVDAFFMRLTDIIGTEDKPPSLR